MQKGLEVIAKVTGYQAARDAALADQAAALNNFYELLDEQGVDSKETYNAALACSILGEGYNPGRFILDEVVGPVVDFIIR